MKTPLLTCCLLSVLVSDRGDAEVPVMFPDDEKYANSGGHDFLVKSTIPGDFKTPEGVVAAILTLGGEVADKKLSFPFTPDTLRSSSHFEGAKPLVAYYRGAVKEGKVFTVSFSRGAERYLNNTAAIQEIVKGALEASIRLNFPDVERVEYKIDGKINAGDA